MLVLSLAIALLPSGHAGLINPDFGSGLDGWTATQAGGAAAPGEVVAVPGGARLLEGDSFHVALAQAFEVPPRWVGLSFTVEADPGFDGFTLGVPDAFEARVVDARGRAVVAPWRAGTTSFFNLQEDGRAWLADGVSWDGRTVTLTPFAVPAGDVVTLQFDLVGGDVGVVGGVTVGGVVLHVQNEPPLADAGPDRSEECAVAFVLDGSASLDGDGDPLTFSWADAAGDVVGDTPTLERTLGVGVYTYSLAVADVLGAVATDEIEVTVADTLPPAVTAPGPVSVPVDAACGGVVPDLTGVGSAADLCAGALPLAQDPPPGTPLVAGVATRVELTAVDPAGAVGRGSTSVSLVDPSGACGLPLETGTVDTFVRVDTAPDTDPDTDPLPDTDPDTDPLPDTDPDSDGDTDPLPETDVETDPPGDDTDREPVDTDDSDERDVEGDKDDDGGECGCATADPGPLAWALLAAAALRRRRRAAAIVGALASGGALAAEPAALDQELSGEVVDADDVDTFELTVPPGQVVYLDAIDSSNPTGLAWTLEDRWGRAVRAASASFADLGRVSLMGGTYTLRVHSASGGSGTWRARVWAVSDGALDGAGGVPLSGDIDVPSRVDRWDLSLEAGLWYFDVLSVPYPWNLDWRLQDPSGRALFGWIGALVDAGAIPLAGGDYTLTVSGRADLRDSYSVRAVASTSADLGVVGLGDEAVGAVAAPGGVASWTVDVPTTGVYSVVTRATDNFWGLGLGVADARGASVVQQTNMTDVIRLPLAAGRHTLSVRGQGEGVGTFRVVVLPVVDAWQEAVLGGAWTADITTPGQRSSFQFTAVEGEQVWLSPIQVPFPWGFPWEIVSSHGEVVASGPGGLFFSGPHTLRAGTYTLTVSPSGGSLGTSVFALRGVPELSGTMSMAAPVTGAVTEAGASARWQLDVTSRVRADLVVDAVDNPWGLRLELLDESGRRFWGPSFLFSTAGPVLGPGRYQVRLYGEGTALGTATFRLVDGGAPPAPTGGTTVAPAIPQSGTTLLGAPVQHRLDVPADGTIYLDLTTGWWSNTWTLYDLDGRPVYGPAAASDVWGGDARLSVAAGSYLLEFSTSEASAPYGFTWFVVPERAPEVWSLGVPVSGALTTPGEVHTGVLDLAAATDVYLALTAGHPDLRLTLTDEVGSVRVAGRQLASPGWQDLGPLRLGPGRWTWQLSAAGAALPSWSLSLHDAAPARAPVTLGDFVVTLGSPGSWWEGSFTATGDELLFVDVTTAPWDWYLTLIDPAGRVRLGPSFVGGVEHDLGPYPLTAGTWTLRVDPNLGYTGALGARLLTSSTVSRSAAVDVPFGDTFAGPADEHRWTFTVDRSTRLWADVLAGAWPLHWRIVDAAGRDVLGLTGMFGDWMDVGPLDVAAGTYTVIVRPTVGATPTYQALLRTVVDASEPVQIGDDVVGSIRSPGGTSSYSFAVEDGAEVYLNLDAGDWSLEWTLLDEVGEPVFGPAPAYDVIAHDRGPFVLAGGTYTVRMDAWAGATPAYQFSIGQVGVDDRDFFYTRYSGLPNLKRASWTYREGAFRVGLQEAIASTPGADGLLVAPDGDIIIGGQGSVVYKVDRDTGSYLAASTGGGGSYHVALDPSGTKIWTSGMPGSVSEIPLVPFGDGVTRDVIGDDPGITHLAFDRLGRAWYSASGGGGYGSFGSIDLTTLRTTRLYSTMPAAHGLAFDPYTDTVILTGSNRVVQIDVDSGTIVAEYDVGPGIQLDQGTVDGAGHLFAADNFGKLLFIDYAATGRIDDPSNYVYLRFLDHNLDDVAPMSWLGSACVGGPPVRELTPAAGTSLPAGQAVLLSGAAVPVDPTRPVAAVLVEGAPVESLDVTGRFFTPYTVVAGEQLVTIEAFDRCGRTQVELRLRGVGSAGEDPTTALSEVSASLRSTLRDTTWSTDGQRLLVDAWGEVTGDVAVSGPLMLAVGRDLDPRVTLANPAGVTAEGLRYVQVVGPGEVLSPGEVTPAVTLALHNPEQVPVRFTPVWLAPADAPPTIVSAPPAQARVGARWRYAARAVDADGHAVTWSLGAGPVGMIVDSGGVAEWTPAAGDVGTHQVSLVATDALGASATQSFTLYVVAVEANRPPVITSAPVARASSGAAWRYAAAAGDPDGDPITWTVTGPAGMAVDAAGVVTWGFALPGQHPVRLRAEDGRGGGAEQAWTLTVGEFPLDPSAPRITTAPPTLASVSALYFYQPLASDADGDTLTWVLSAGPAGMSVDRTSGRVMWTPAAGQLGAHPVAIAVDDGRGASTTQSWTLEVSAGLPDRAPVFSSAPLTVGVAGAPWSYLAVATDPEVGVVRYGLATGPSGLAVDADSGLVSWPSPVAGTWTVGLTAADAAGNTASQVFFLTVRSDNAAPRFLSAPATADVFVGQPWSHDHDAVDADGDALRWTMAGEPAGVALDPRSGVMRWTPDAAGSYLFQVTVTDPWGASATQDVVVNVTVDEEPPGVGIGAPATACLGDVVLVCVAASDAAGIGGRTLAVDGDLVPLDALGCAEVTADATGGVDLSATATDSSGNEGVADDVLAFVDCANPNAPTVTWISPAPGSVLEGPTSVWATIDDDDPVGLTWRVEVSRRGEEDWRVLAVGRGPVDGEVGRVDTTLLGPGDWDVRVFAEDGVNFNDTRAWFGVTDAFKPGRFQVSFLDASFELRGIGLSVHRTYDSLDLRPGDFGPGWTLGLAGGVWDTALESTHPDPFIAMLSQEGFVDGTRVYVRRPDGVTVGFTFHVQMATGMVPFAVVPSFEADPPFRDELVAEGSPVLFTYGTGSVYDFFIPYNPTRYTLRTPEGMSWTFDEADGLVHVEDAFAHTVDVRDDGLFHSSGDAVTFVRDGEGRISEVRLPDDPADAVPEAVIRYAYDGAGDLVEVTDPVGLVRSYRYDAPGWPHLLTDLVEPSGQVTVRNVYDDDGRVVAQCGPDGDVVTLEGCQATSFDPDTLVQTMFDAEGHPATMFFSATGDLIAERHVLEDGSTWALAWTWDDRHGMLTEDVNGRVWTYERNELGEVAREIDPDGLVHAYTFDDCGEIASVTDPVGNTWTWTRDEYCDLVRIENALGAWTTFEYDDFGDLVRVYDAGGEQWTFAYDERGRTVRRTDPRGADSRWTWTAAGDPATDTDRTGAVRTFTYDAARRPLTETWSTGEVFTWDWAEDGTLEALRDDAGDEVAFGYLPTGRVAWERQAPAGGPATTFSLGYDRNGRLTSIQDDLGGEARHHLDALGRVEQSVWVSAGVADRSARFGWDSQGRLASVRRFADAAGLVPVVDTTLAYAGGSQGRLGAITHGRAGQPPVHAMTFDVDPRDGRLDGWTDAEGAHQVEQDATGRLLAVDHPGGVQPDEVWSYDAMSGRTTSHLTSTAQVGRDLGEGGWQLRRDDHHEWTWDAEGRLRRRVDRATGAVVELSWDLRDRLVAMVEKDGAGTVQHTTAWRYDPLDRRVGVVRDGVETWRYEQGANPVLERSADGSVLVRRDYGIGLDLAMTEVSGGQVRWLLADQVGSVRDVVSGAGVVLDHRVYDSFGRPLGGGAVGTLGFGGRPSEPRTGFVDFRSRFYDPGSGRWLSEDPMAPFTQAFVGGDPLLQRDPWGQSDAVEYACLAVQAYGNYVSFAGAFLSFASMLDGAVRELLKAFEGPLGPMPGAQPSSAAYYVGRSLPPASVAPLVSLASSLCSTRAKVKAADELLTGPKKGIGRKLVDWDHSTYHKMPRKR